MTAQPIEEGLVTGELLKALIDDNKTMSALVERVGGMKESWETFRTDTFADFRRETRENFEQAKTAVADLRTEISVDTQALRTQMQVGFEKQERRTTDLETRVRTVEDKLNTQQGGRDFGKWVLGALGPISAIVAWLARGAA